MSNSGYRPRNRGNEQSELFRELAEPQIYSNGHIRFATAYRTRDGKSIVVELYGNTTQTHNYPYQTQDQEILESRETSDDSHNIEVPSTVRTWVDFDPMKRVRVTRASDLTGNARKIWREDVEGFYRDDPFKSSHFYQQFDTLNRD